MRYSKQVRDGFQQPWRNRHLLSIWIWVDIAEAGRPIGKICRIQRGSFKENIGEQKKTEDSVTNRLWPTTPRWRLESRAAQC